MVTDAMSASEIAEMLANRNAQSGESATKKRGGRPKKTTEDK